MGEEFSDITIVLEIVQCRDESTDDHILLESLEIIDLARSRSIDEDSNCLLE